MEYFIPVSLIILWCIVLCNVFLTLALIRQVNRISRSKEKAPETGLKAGEQAPPFSAQTVDGETVTLSNYQGKTTALIFLSAHCKPCRELLPDLKIWSLQALDAGIAMILVSSDDLEATSAMIEENAIHMPALIAPRSENSFFTDYRITGTPSYCVIDEHGHVHSTGHPSMLFGEWKAFVDFSLKNTIKV